MGLWYSKDSGFELIAYADADHARCNDDCKSTSGGIQFMRDKLVSWSSKKQDCTAMSSVEVEYVSFLACCAQVIWMRTQLLDYGFHYHKILIYCDSKSAIELYFVGAEYQLANLFTKPFQRKVLQSIPCSPECKIVGLILLDHCLSHALTATADVPAVYLQQFWRTVSKVPDTEDTIKFMMDTQQFTYTVDIVGYQGVVDKLFHVVLNQTHVDYAALLWWDFMNNVFSKKESIQYPRFIKFIIADLMKKFPNIPKRLEEDYHSIKDDVPLTNDFKELMETGDYDGLAVCRRIPMKISPQSFSFYPKLLMLMVDGLMCDDMDPLKVESGVIKERSRNRNICLMYVSRRRRTMKPIGGRKKKEVVEIVKETNVDDEMNKKDKEVEKEKEVVEIVKEKMLMILVLRRMKKM
ncbi:hypothetical protein Tco_0060333 [Tanacetum coccineum]